MPRIHEISSALAGLVLRRHEMSLSPVQPDGDDLSQQIDDAKDNHDNEWELTTGQTANSLSLWSHVVDDARHDPGWKEPGH